MKEKTVTGNIILEYITPPSILPNHTKKDRIQITGIVLLSWNSVRAQVVT